MILDYQRSLSSRLRKALPPLLRSFLVSQRWFGAKARALASIEVVDVIPVPVPSAPAYIILVRVEYAEGDTEIYDMPLIVASQEQAARVLEGRSPPPCVRLAEEGTDGALILYDALWNREFTSGLLGAIGGGARFKGTAGEVVASQTKALLPILDATRGSPEPSVMKAEQSNSSVNYGDCLVLKFFRRLQEGINPDLELGAFLTERTAFKNLPPVAGFLEYRRGQNEPMTLGILQGYVPNEGDAWEYTLDALSRYYEQAAGQPGEAGLEWQGEKSLLDLAQQELPPLAQELIGPYRDSAWRLGHRTAEMHMALGSAPEDPVFAPEPFTPFYQRSLFQSMRNLTVQSLGLLRRKLKDLPESQQAEAQKVLDLEDEILRRFRAMLDRKISGMRTRIHGDYHLGQVLYTGNDFVIIDFEGEPARTISERRIKRSPLRDVGGMLRSFHYAAYSALLGRAAGRVVRPEDLPMLEPWANYWNLGVSAIFLKSYLEGAGEASFLPRGKEELGALLDTYLLEKVIYELAYELNNRPDWVRIPLRGILQLLETRGWE